MKVWTAHFRHDSQPLLVRDGFSWGALFFGPLWLATHHAWIPASISLVLVVVLALLAPEPVRSIGLLALAWLHGLSGRDLCRWSLENRGFLERHVLVGRTEADALDRLLHARPELVSNFARDLP